MDCPEKNQAMRMTWPQDSCVISEPGFLYLSTVDILRWVSLSVGGGGLSDAF